MGLLSWLASWLEPGWRIKGREEAERCREGVGGRRTRRQHPVLERVNRRQLLIQSEVAVADAACEGLDQQISSPGRVHRCPVSRFVGDVDELVHTRVER